MRVCSHRRNGGSVVFRRALIGYTRDAACRKTVEGENRHGRGRYLYSIRSR